MTTGPSPRRRLLMRLLLYGGAFFVGIPLAFAHVMTRPVRFAAPSPPSPPYEEIALRADGLRLRAWLAAGDPSKPAAIVVHGFGDSLESYLGHARPLREAGLSVLLVDLRGHGGSEGTRTSLGGNEREDVRAGMALLRERGLAKAGLVLEGHSMGSVAVLRAAAGQSDVRAVIAEAPYDDYRSTIAHHAWLLYKVPSWLPIVPTAIAFAEGLAGFDADEIDAVSAAARIRAPLLLIVDGDDARMPEPVVRRVLDAHPGPKRLWVAPGVDHVGAILRPEYPEIVIGFLRQQGVL